MADTICCPPSLRFSRRYFTIIMFRLLYTTYRYSGAHIFVNALDRRNAQHGMWVTPVLALRESTHFHIYAPSDLDLDLLT